MYAKSTPCTPRTHREHDRGHTEDTPGESREPDPKALEPERYSKELYWVVPREYAGGSREAGVEYTESRRLSAGTRST